MDLLLKAYGFVAMVRLHPFWNRSFWRAFGAIGIVVAIACWLGASFLCATFLGHRELGSFLGFLCLMLIPAPALALPLCASFRLYAVLCSHSRAKVADWAISHVIGILLIVAGFMVREPLSLYLFAAGGVVLCLLPVIAFERIYGKIEPE